LDKNVILGRLAPLNANEKYIVAVVATINLSLASYRVLTKTQIQWVLKNLFTNIVPVGTDISAGVGIAYKTLLHTTIMDLPSEPLRTKLTRMWYKIRNYVPIPLDLDADACYHLLQMENECLDSLRDNMAPARAEEYTSNWIAAMSLMINKVPNEITDGIAEAVIEEDSKDKDIFYESVEFQDEGIFVDEDIFVDAVSDQQPTTPSSVSRKRKNTCDSEDSDAVSQSQSDDEAATKKRKTLTDTGDLYQPAPINDIREPKVSSIIKRTNRG
jgi:hypothetical protein